MIALRPTLALLFAVFSMCGSIAKAAPVDFTGINVALVTSASGQDFAYTVGLGPTTGTLNVRWLSGDISTLTVGQSPDPTGFYVLQSPALSPVTFKFTFDAPRDIAINSNETLTAREQNTFTLPPGSPGWSIISVVDATVAPSADAVTFTGTRESPPYGQFSISTFTESFDFLVTNIPGYPIYGSGLSIDVLDHVTSAGRSSWDNVKRLYR